MHDEQCYSNIEYEALGILHGIDKPDHYCFAKEVYLITVQKTLLAIISKDVATLYQHLQLIMLHIHQYRLHILYKPGPNLYIADWLSQNNHTENRDQEITGMNMYAISISVNAPLCTSIEDIQAAT